MRAGIAIGAVVYAIVSVCGGQARAQVCDADYNSDGLVGAPDVSSFAMCYRTPGGSGCARADLDEDGDIDLCDYGALQCLFGTDSSDATCCVDPVCATCPCVAELDGESPVSVLDVSVVTSCFGLPLAGDCASADVNCDRVVDRCDVDIVTAAFGETHVLGLCEMVVCGACRTPEGCQNAGEASCASLGGELTPGARCGDATEELDYRGGGGFSCASSPRSWQEDWLALMFGGLLVLLLARTRGWSRGS